MSQYDLSGATFRSAEPGVRQPAYDPARITAGIVHLGPGAFHRAHQAPAFDALLADDPRWGIIEVSLHSPGVRDALAPQNGLYTLALLDEEVSFQIIGAIVGLLVAPEDPAAVFERLAAPETRIVTLTITEKGYCLDAGGLLDLLHSDIKADIATPTHPRSALGFLVEGLHRRFATGRAPFVLLSCDNLVDNGRKLAAGVATLARAQERSAAFVTWLAHELASPRTMVDSITPATDDALRERVIAATGLRDRWPIQREAFTQWVIENDSRLPDLDWNAAGITLTDDVTAFERAKLRVLNASHSSLAYLGLLRGHETVAEAMADSDLAHFVRALMEQDVSPSLDVPFDLAAYREAVLKRFRNPAMRHFLSQIAWDGSQKLPNRLFGLIEEALAADRPIARPARPIAAWFLFLRAKARSGEKLIDPLAPALLELAQQANGDAAHDVALFLGLEAVFPRQLAAQDKFRLALTEAYAELLLAP